MDNPKVSVVVPAYNAEKTIQKCLDSLLRIDYPFYEIVVVDDGSTDGTWDILRKYSAANSNVKCIRQKNKGPAAARNRGVRKSIGEVIFFTDSDCIVPRDWVTRLLRYFGDESIGAAGGSLKPATVNSIFEQFDQKRRENLYGNIKRFIDALPTCNLAVRRNVFEEVGGFDESFKCASAEDYDLCYRMRDRGYKIFYDPEVSVLHYHSQDIRSLLRRGYIHGREGVKLRAKGKYPMYKEVISLAKFVLLPLTSLRCYPGKLYFIGLLYDLTSYAGKLSGLLRYRRS